MFLRIFIQSLVLCVFRFLWLFVGVVAVGVLLLMFLVVVTFAVLTFVTCIMFFGFVVTACCYW